MVNPYCLSHEDNAVTVRLTKTPYGQLWHTVALCYRELAAILFPVTSVRVWVGQRKLAISAKCN